MGPGRLSGLGTGLFLGRTGLGQRRRGTSGLGERGDDLDGPDGRAEFLAQRIERGGSLGELIASAQRLGPAALAAGQAVRVLPGGLRLVEFGAVGADLPRTGGRLGGRGRGELFGPGRIGQVIARAGGSERGVRACVRAGVRAGVRGLPRRGRICRGRNGDLGDAGDQFGDALPGLLDAARGGPAPLGQPRFDGAEPVGAEQLLQQLSPVVGVGVQEVGELALRQQHDLPELQGGHAHEISDLVVRLTRPGGNGPPGGAVGLFQDDLGVLGGSAAAPALGAFLLGAAGDTHPAAAERGLELDLGRHVGRGVVRAQPPGLAALARDLTVEGEPEGVEQGGLARAGLAVQQEQASLGQIIKADLDGAAERAEGGHAQPVRAHQPASAVRTAWNASASRRCSSGVAGAPRTCWTNSPATARSSRPATRSR